MSKYFDMLNQKRKTYMERFKHLEKAQADKMGGEENIITKKYSPITLKFFKLDGVRVVSVVVLGGNATTFNIEDVFDKFSGESK
jgi:hypothetical protein